MGRVGPFFCWVRGSRPKPHEGRAPKAQPWVLFGIASPLLDQVLFFVLFFLVCVAGFQKESLLLPYKGWKDCPCER